MGMDDINLCLADDPLEFAHGSRVSRSANARECVGRQPPGLERFDKTPTPSQGRDKECDDLVLGVVDQVV
jgi:hypothetical protein